MARKTSRNEFATKETRCLKLVSYENDDAVIKTAVSHKQKYVLPGQWDKLVTEWVTWLAAAGMPKTTQRTRRGHVRKTARASGAPHPRDITPATLIGVCSDPSWSNEHRRGVRRSLISFFTWTTDHGHTPHNPAETLPRVSSGTPNPKPVPNPMWKQILMAAPPRERMMMRLAGEVGMRRAEVACCHRDDLIEDLCGWSLIIHGKGGKQRMVPISDKLARDIAAFRDHGYLFPGQDNGHLAAMTVGKLVGDLMPPGWSMHKLRHRFATRTLAAGGDLLVVRDLLGHASVATTQLYTASVPEKMRRITDLLAQED